MSKAELETDYKCKSCGTVHEFPSTVFAHWNEKHTHTCEVCGAKHEVLRGKATQILPGKPPKVKK